ncbi:DUF1887 family protein [Candidatus Bipolaricaulota bacterium]|nr:DUF1887 family protein [Candidatus Bipolaricaulota bacterium]
MHVVGLIGEQPMPCLVVLRYLEPDSFTLVCTAYTRRIAERLKKLVKAQAAHILEVPAYKLGEIRRSLLDHLEGLGEKRVAFDLTGGTKTMAFATYDVARLLSGVAYYLRSQMENVLFEYAFGTGDSLQEREIALPMGLFTIRDFLGAYLDEFKITGPCKSPQGRQFEIAVRDSLSEVVDEIEAGVRSISGQLDLDLVFRVGNGVGVAEVKTGRKAEHKEPLEQLKSACSKEILGTYTKPFLIIDREWGPDKQNLRDLASAWDITVIELPSFRDTGSLCAEDKEKLQTAVKKVLGG